MRIDRLMVENYRRFDDFAIDLHPNITVVAARNGLGKTTVLEAIALSLGPFVGAFDDGKSENIKRADARRRIVGGGPENEQCFPVSVAASFSDPDIVSVRELRSVKGSTTTGGSSDLAGVGKELQDKVRSEGDVDLPVVRYYSSKRLWAHHNANRSRAVLTRSRTAGYEDCLSPLSSYKQLQDWVRAATLADLQQHQRSDRVWSGPDLGRRLRGISRAVDIVMEDEGWSGFHYSLTFDELAMFHPDHGDLPLTVLSDGVRAMAALTADLAQRCVRLNGHLGEDAPRRTSGIVLIDEVDLHLHPVWQQRVLEGLTTAFPLIQFIVTTHSPQVLSTTARESIRRVFRDGDGRWRAEEPQRAVKGLASSVALNEVMDVNPVPAVEESWKLAEYTALIEEGRQESEEAARLRDELEGVYGSGHPVLVDADRLIRFQQFRLRKAPGSRDVLKGNR